jgi:hypothetical protein
MANDQIESTPGTGPTEREHAFSAIDKARQRAQRVESPPLSVERQLQQVLAQRSIAENAAEATRHQADALRKQQQAEINELRAQMSAMTAGAAALSRAQSPGEAPTHLSATGTTYGTGHPRPPAERWGIVEDGSVSLQTRTPPPQTAPPPAPMQAPLARCRFPCYVGNTSCPRICRKGRRHHGMHDCLQHTDTDSDSEDAFRCSIGVEEAGLSKAGKGSISATPVKDRKRVTITRSIC